ncbi:hypothetical protein BGW36DRAFT_433094 [Talaromyces proteolyticus]|uniref:Uncharacterized protein n=1 Tax=Talaromyces proteolyticus TaxID=1131652 RepID=A0AAD4KIH8_9EURO|nr:uncharacterized protein BGW36DRAFT_433094 [Talaromyces proteolyticus]KAH8690140.1 hypothetical protein BGW36DRAFT_433094 [Talaromyces proteolyticus]
MPRHRHYSWPFSGPTRVEDVPVPAPLNPDSQYQPFTSSLPLQQENGKERKPLALVKDTFHRPLSPDTLTFPYSSSDEEDVFISAGIVSKEKHRRHRTKKRRRSRVHKKITKNQPKEHDHAEKNESHEQREEQREVIISSITEANHVPTAMLRRIIWPRLEKARQFLIPLHLHFSSSLPSSGSTHSSVSSAKETIVLSCASTPTLSETEDVSFSMAGEDWRLRPGRRHRRCHSEQPRAWREPSAGLWTLDEE